MKKRENRTKTISVYCTAEDYAVLRQNCARTNYKHFSTYVRKMMLSEPVEITTRDLSLDALIDSLTGLREQLERLLERPYLSADDKQRFFELLREMKPVLNKIADLCILKSN